MNISDQVSLLYEDLRKILYFDGIDKNIDFFISSLTEYNPYYETNELKDWIKTINQKQFFNVTEIPLNEMKEWYFDDKTNDLKHSSGGFFSIRGLKVETNMGEVNSWSQPVIYQPEIGVLGIITKKINGILYFLLQAKAEPGNINTYQISPTVQATRSNYLQIHGGKPTQYLDYFIGDKKSTVLIDQLQSEQGARFYRKRNRNVIVRIKNNDEIDLGDNYRWFTLGQIYKLCQIDNTINMDTRSVISSISFEPEKLLSKKPPIYDDLLQSISDFKLSSNNNSNYCSKLMISSHPNSKTLNTLDDIYIHIAKKKFECELNVSLIPLNKVDVWTQNIFEIYHPERKYFSIIGLHIEAMNREVDSWDQPIVKQDTSGIVGFIIKEIDGVFHFLIQLKSESGVMDLLELAPTVQCITSNYNQKNMPLYVNELLKSDTSEKIADVYQSEEGGRFYKESNRNIILLNNDSADKLKNNFIWMNLFQLKQLIKINNFLNVEARSLLASLNN